jgi:catechol 2,3-dioxygenase-like lactoylglutathione lyase family enzyme
VARVSGWGAAAEELRMGDTRLDHVALAVWRWSDARATLVDQLGGRWSGGVRMAEYSPCQLAFANGMRVELLQPGTDDSSFLARFLARSGAGPHHVTFKVDDLSAAIRRARNAGLQIVRERRDNPAWQEAFLHPRSTGVGFVIQLAQSDIAPGAAMASAPGAVSAAAAGLSPSAPGLSPSTAPGLSPSAEQAPALSPAAEQAPAPAAAAARAPAEPASIPFFTAAVPDLDDATALLTEVLHGTAGDEGGEAGVRFRVVSWQADTARIVLTEGNDGPAAETPPPGIQALAVTAGADPGFPAENHVVGWDATPLIPELGVRLLTKFR